MIPEVCKICGKKTLNILYCSDCGVPMCSNCTALTCMTKCGECAGEIIPDYDAREKPIACCSCGEIFKEDDSYIRCDVCGEPLCMACKTANGTNMCYYCYQETVSWGIM